MDTTQTVLERVLRRLVAMATRLEETQDVVVPKHHIRQLLHPGLAVVHIKSKLRYTVSAVDNDRNSVVLSTPEKKSFEVDMSKFGSEYAVD